MKRKKKYLLTIPESKMAIIRPWNPKTREVAEKLARDLQAASPGVKVVYTGASSLGIAGTNDIDLCVLIPRKEFEKHLPGLRKVLGEPTKIGKENIRWKHVTIDGFEVDCHMTEPQNEQLQDHLRLVQVLRNNPELLDEYEKLKIDSSSLPYREYQRRKYEFYNRTLLSSTEDKMR